MAPTGGRLRAIRQCQFSDDRVEMQAKIANEAHLDMPQAAVLAVAVSLPPEHADFARRVFAAGVACLNDQSELDANADTTSARVAAAVPAKLGQPSAGSVGDVGPDRSGPV